MELNPAAVLASAALGNRVSLLKANVVLKYCCDRPGPTRMDWMANTGSWRSLLGISLPARGRLAAPVQAPLPARAPLPPTDCYAGTQ